MNGFWNPGTGSYRDILIQLIAKDQVIRIQKYVTKPISTFPVR